jgi:hypothetical protein
VKIEYFGTVGNPFAFRGHYWSGYKYDELGCLNEAVFSFQFDRDSVLNRTFRFGPEGTPHVHCHPLAVTRKISRLHSDD